MAAITDANEDRWILLRLANPTGWINHDLLALIRTKLLPYLPMVSGAGHDAGYMNRVCPTAMIFVPSIGGRSHVEVENTRWEDCEAGANVLLHAMLHSANEN